jgi:hypothetical protein
MITEGFAQLQRRFEKTRVEFRGAQSFEEREEILARLTAILMEASRLVDDHRKIYSVR